MKLITGATGQLGGAILKNLLQTEEATSLAALVRDTSKAEELRQAGISIRQGDYFDAASLEKAFQGISQLVLVSSNDFEDRLGQHQRVVDAAVKAGVQHILYTGVSLKSIDISPLKPLLNDHYATEAYIQASGLNYTFLQHTLYAEVIPIFLGPQVFETGVFFPVGDGKVPFVTRTDLAAAIAQLLRTKGHENKTYRMTNNQLWGFAEIAKSVSDLAGKEVPFISPEASVYEEVLRNAALPEEIIQMSLGFAAAIAHHDFEEVFPDLEQILGRAPVDLNSYLKSVY